MSDIFGVSDTHGGNNCLDTHPFLCVSACLPSQLEDTGLAELIPSCFRTTYHSFPNITALMVRRVVFCPHFSVSSRTTPIILHRRGHSIQEQHQFNVINVELMSKTLIQHRTNNIEHPAAPGYCAEIQLFTSTSRRLGQIKLSSILIYSHTQRISNNNVAKTQ